MSSAHGSPPNQAPRHRKAGRREWTGLAVLLLPLLLVSMDVSVLYFAVPFISRDLQPSSTQQLWIFDIYGFVLAGLLITMGSLGDRIGRRRLLLIGAFCFSLASLGAAYSHSASELIAARAVQGVAGATLMPSTLALIRNMFHDEKQRRTAIAIWTSATMSGIALGPVLSGFLLDHFWWGSVFLINVPFMILLLGLGPALVPEFRAPQAGRFDFISAALSLAAVLPVIYGMQEISANGAQPANIAAIIAGVAVGAAFVLRQARSRVPMIELALFRSRGFTGAVALNLVSMFAIVGFAIFATQYLQSVRGMSPFTAALWSMVPMAGTLTAVPLSQLLVKRVDRGYIAAGGLLVAAAGFALLARAQANSGLWFVLLGASIYAGGVLTAVTVGNELIMGAVTPARAGAASAVVETSSEFGGALGMAMLGSIGVAVYRSDLTHTAPAGLPSAAMNASRSTLGGALSVAEHLPAQLGAQLVSAARAAFTHGLNAAALGAALAMFVAAVLSARFFRGIDVVPDGAQPDTLDTVTPRGTAPTDGTGPEPELVR
ncbi:MAG TPA: MFS transporter [Streptosporangiaceae bacterium]|jgi:DHA2 family multidrug resistance protein-like MFS transporter|nr:MFS transporter [Streptosporangiaceae bacterium]